MVVVDLATEVDEGEVDLAVGEVDEVVDEEDTAVEADTTQAHQQRSLVRAAPHLPASGYSS